MGVAVREGAAGRVDAVRVDAEPYNLGYREEEREMIPQQKLAAQRVDAEKRASVAFEEMNRATKELRARHGNDPASDPSLTPGERLQRMYPGAKRPTAASESQSS